jgi:hypothetical protein
MFKRWFEFSSNDNGSGDALAADHQNGAAALAVAVLDPPETTARPENERPSRPPVSSPATVTGAPSADRADFDQIYRNAGVKSPQIPRGILKVVEMVNSDHLSGLLPDARRCAVAMALDAVGARVEDLLQDAVVRQRALNDYEREQQDNLRRFEEGKVEENRGFQAELERLTNQYMARVQANIDEVAREQDKFRAWQRRKHQETQQIAEAAAFCVPEGLGSNSGGLTAVLERACVAKR